jgi:membrane protein
LVAKNVFLRVSEDNLTLTAAGVAFYAMIAIFPAMAAFVSIYGLFADPSAIPQQVAGFSNLLPSGSLKLLTDALQNFANKSSSTLNIALIISIGLAVWGAKAGVSSLMTGLNIANGTVEKRSLWMQQIVALILILGTVLFAIVAIVSIAFLPVAVRVLSLSRGIEIALGLGRWPLLAVLICFGLTVVYRYGPCREIVDWKWITGEGRATEKRWGGLRQ